MIESLIVGLVLAGVSAVTFVAYKHPGGYARMYLWLNIATVSISWGLCFYNVLDVVGSALVINHLVSVMPNSQLSSIADQASKLRYSLKIIGWTLFVATIILGYFAFLKFLPLVLGIKEKKDAV